jgi:two-component system, NtrC family, sensor kinase
MDCHTMNLQLDPSVHLGPRDDRTDSSLNGDPQGADISTTHSQNISSAELQIQIQHRMVEKLAESERRYRELLENLPEIVFTCDRSGQFTFLNQAWTRILGHDIKASLGRSMVEFLQADDQEPCLDGLVQLPTGQSLSGQELRFDHADGRVLWLELSARLDVLQGISGSLTNITPRKQAEQAMLRLNEALEDRVTERTEALQQQAVALETALVTAKQAQSQLVQAEKMSSLGQLVAGIAHEINNPVNFIHGNLTHARGYIAELQELVGLYQKHYPHPVAEIAETIEDLDLDFLLEDLTKLLTSMKVGTDRIREIVLSLRNFSRLDEADIKPVNIHEGLDSTLMILQGRLKATDHRPDIQIVRRYGDLPLVECYAGQLNQVFMNLISNAIDAMEAQTEPAPTIGITTASVVLESGGSTLTSTEIRITDNGGGIPIEVQQRIFEPFFTTKPVGKGTGLGLSISYQVVVDRHQGTFTCQSTPGQGTEFTIRLPTLAPIT